MNPRILSIALLVLAVGLPPGTLPTVPALLLSTLAVIHFWWTHAFRLQAINWKFLLLFGALSLSTWWLMGGTGVTGLPQNPDFNPSQLSALKRSHRVALRLFFDHEPKPDERYLRLGIQAPLSASAGDSQSRSWAATQLGSRPLDKKLNRIRDWFRSSFTYSLDSDWKDLDSFLFDQRRGYCQHFSYATQALLSRSGENAQMVYGYSGGSWNPLTRILTYHDADAHSWLEVLDPVSRSWIRVDPTAWVISIGEQEEGPLRPWVTRAGLEIGMLLLACIGMLGFFFQSPRRHLYGLLKTRGPISNALLALGRQAREENDEAMARCCEQVREEYERIYFSKGTSAGGSVLLRLRLLQLRILGWKYLSRLRRGHSRL